MKGRTVNNYEVTPSDVMHAKYLKDKIASFDGRMFIPSNLVLLATMNSSDQAVMPMDTAFKRRWSFEYIPLDFDLPACAKNNINIVKTASGGHFDIEWKNFAQVINDVLSNLGIPEDRHIGPFFVTDNELSDAEKSASTLSGKVFMYLWDDVLRHKGRSSIFDDKYKSNGALMTAFKKNEPVFNSKLLDIFEISTVVREDLSYDVSTSEDISLAAEGAVEPFPAEQDVYNTEVSVRDAVAEAPSVNTDE
jgi:hypothetical protein